MLMNSADPPGREPPSFGVCYRTSWDIMGVSHPAPSMGVPPRGPWSVSFTVWLILFTSCRFEALHLMIRWL